MDKNPVAVYLGRLTSAASRSAIEHALTLAARAIRPGETAWTIAWHGVRYQHAAFIRARLVEGIEGKRFEPSTINLSLTAVRGVTREAWRLGLMSGEEQARVQDVKSVRATRLPKGRAIDPEEIDALYAAAEGTTGVRDAAIVAATIGGGLRRAEVVGLDLASYDARRGALRVHGKGNKERLIPLAVATVERIDAWIAERRRGVGDVPGPLFLPYGLDGVMRLSRLRAPTVRVVLDRLRRRAEGEPFTPHDFRRTYITDGLAADIDLSVMQRLAGHASIATTALYDRRGDDALRSAADKIATFRERKLREAREKKK